MAYKTPVIFIIFNRPDTTRKVLETIKEIKPNKLYVISDGPRNEKEQALVNETRALIEEIDWDCNIRKIYSDYNMGCGRRVSSGISEVFKYEEYSVINFQVVLIKEKWTYWLKEAI